MSIKPCGTWSQPSIFGQRAIDLAFRNVPDLPETEVIKLLCLAQKGGPSFGSLDVQVDASSSDDIPALSSVLAACVAYPASDATLRMAIREQLNHAESIIPILVVLDDWLVKLSSSGAGLILDADLVGNDDSLVVSTQPCSGAVEIPPLDKVCKELLPNASTDSHYKDLGISPSNS
jgi:hypothetical protein